MESPPVLRDLMGENTHFLHQIYSLIFHLYVDKNTRTKNALGSLGLNKRVAITHRLSFV